jgi:hypothetical protein
VAPGRYLQELQALIYTSGAVVVPAAEATLPVLISVMAVAVVVVHVQLTLPLSLAQVRFGRLLSELEALERQVLEVMGAVQLL